MLQSLKRMTLLFAVLMPLAYTGMYLFEPLNPMGQATAEYKQHFAVTSRPPFVVRYYLLTPQGYDEAKTYPLVLALHGMNRTSYIAEKLADPAVRAKYPAFVVVPVAPQKFYWAAPDEDARMGEWFAGLPIAMSILEGIKSSYPVDLSRIYVTGNSMGGFGAFGAVSSYPDVFAAAVPMCGGWSPADAQTIRSVPIWAFHGANDDLIPASHTKDTVAAVQKLGGLASYAEIRNGGHRCEYDVLKTDAVWSWMFRQSRG